MLLASSDIRSWTGTQTSAGELGPSLGDLSCSSLGDLSCSCLEARRTDARSWLGKQDRTRAKWPGRPSALSTSACADPLRACTGVFSRASEPRRIAHLKSLQAPVARLSRAARTAAAAT